MKTIRLNQILLPLALVAGALSSGCATVTRGTTETILVQSEPAGATVRLSNGISGLTPVNFLVRRKEDLSVVISKDGYEPVEISLPSKLSGAGAAGVAGNLVLGPASLVIYGAVDAATGAALSHTPNPVKVVLKPVVPAPAIATGSEVASAETTSR